MASRSPAWHEQLNTLGIRTTPTSSIFDLAAGFQAAVDSHLIERGRTSDFSEIAQKAAGEALCTLAADQSSTLFGDSAEELRVAVRSLSTKVGFGKLSQHFFGQFLSHFLNFYLSRVTASTIGRGQLQSLGSISNIDKALAKHCEQSAAILQDFAGEWYSKTEYERGIDPSNAAGFVAVAVRKLQAEIMSQRAEK